MDRLGLRAGAVGCITLATTRLDNECTGRGKQGERTQLYFIAVSGKLPDVALFFMSITKMTVVTMRRSSEESSWVLGSAVLPQHPSSDSLNTSQLRVGMLSKMDILEDC